MTGQYFAYPDSKEGYLVKYTDGSLLRKGHDIFFVSRFYLGRKNVFKER